MCGMANATCTISECWYVTVVVVAGVICGLIMWLVQHKDTVGQCGTIRL
jgi:hypothetical protein